MDALIEDLESQFPKLMRWIFCLTLALVAPVVAAQHHGHHANSTGADVPSALTPGEVEGLLAGAGMGMAKPAELNDYPGPLHVLELASELDITADQRAEAERLRAEMLAETQALGAQLIAVERHLDTAFEDGTATPADVERITAHAARLRGQIRAAHLKAHIALRPVLSEAQVTRYNALRRYNPPEEE